MPHLWQRLGVLHCRKCKVIESCDKKPLSSFSQCHCCSKKREMFPFFIGSESPSLLCHILGHRAVYMTGIKFNNTLYCTLVSNSQDLPHYFVPILFYLLSALFPLCWYILKFYPHCASEAESCLLLISCLLHGNDSRLLFGLSLNSFFFSNPHSVSVFSPLFTLKGEKIMPPPVLLNR